MKRILAFIMPLVLCLSLCACGGEQNNEIQGSVESNSTSNTTTGSITDSTSGTNDDENTPEEIPNHLLLQYICGEWVMDPNGQAPCQSLMISEDGSCVVDGVSATWKIDSSYTNDTSFGIRIYINNELRFGVVLVRNAEKMNVTMPMDKTFSNSPMYIAGGGFVRKN